MSCSMKGRGWGIERGEGRENWSYVQKTSPLKAAAKYKPGESEDSRADHRRGQGHPRATVTRRFLPHLPRLACSPSVYFVTSAGSSSVSSESIATVNTVIFLRNFTW